MDNSTTTPKPAAKSIKGTKTEQNIVSAYLSETQAYARYTYYSQQAKKENYFPIQKVFEETAANELHHAKVFFKMLEGGMVTGTLMQLDAGVIGTTEENLTLSIEEEQDQGIDQYKAAAKVALEEGFPEIASHFIAIAAIEEHHKLRFEAWLKHVKAGTCWKRDHIIKWQCLVCGYIFEGTEPPMKCPACDHPREHYMALDI